MVKGKAKGSNFEREIAKYLTNWLTGQQKEYYFWRSPGSGSVSTITNTNPDLHGDIIPLKDEAKIICDVAVFELKNGYPTTSLDKHLKYGKNDNLLSFWKQVNTEAGETNKLPFLIYKKKGLTPWIGINNYTFNKFESYFKEIRYVNVKWEIKIDDLFLFHMDEFFDIITPDIFKRTLCTE